MVLGRPKLGAMRLRRRPDSRPGIGDILFQLGRRDSALLLWLLFALVGLPVLALIMAAIIALCLVRRQRRPAGRRAAGRGVQ